MHDISFFFFFENYVNHISTIKRILCKKISHLKCDDVNSVDSLFINNTEKKYCETDQKEICLVLKHHEIFND